MQIAHRQPARSGISPMAPAAGRSANFVIGKSIRLAMGTTVATFTKIGSWYTWGNGPMILPSPEGVASMIARWAY